MAKVLMIANDNYVVDRRILQQAAYLSKNGYDVEVISGFETPIDTVEMHSGVKVNRFSFIWGNTKVAKIVSRFPFRLPTIFVRGLLRVEKIVVRLIGANTEFEQQVWDRAERFDFDILHVHDMPLLRIGARIAKKRKCKLVYDAHELYFAQEAIPIQARIRMRAEEKQYIKYPDLVYTVNEFIADEMTRLYGRKDIHVLLNSAPEAERNAVSTPTLRELAQLAPETKVVLYQGWVSPERGIEHLIRAAGHFSSRAALVIIGYGPHLDKLKEQVNALGLNRSVIFLGRMSYEELNRLTHQADVGVIPYLPLDFNTKNCSPNKLFEFVASGVPIVANDLPFLRKFITEFECGKVAEVTDEVAFARAVIEVLENESARQGCFKAQDLRGWEAERAKLLTWYQSL